MSASVTDPSTTSDDAETSDDTSQVECAQCAIATPAGWSGPVVVASGDELPECEGAFTGAQVDALIDIAGGAATCGCSCGDPEVDCNELSLLYRQSCGQPVGAENFVEPDTCHDNTRAQNSTNPFYTPLAGTEACPPSETVDVPDATSNAYRMCGGTFVQGECAPGELCVPAIPAGFGAELCIARSGLHDCPPAYPQQQIVFGTIDDSRGCTTCDCTPDSEFECHTTLHVHGDNTCTDFREDVETDSCIASWGSFTFDPPSITGSCTASVAEAEGEAVGGDPTTVCCG